jgi:hypothetical protein
MNFSGVATVRQMPCSRSESNTYRPRVIVDRDSTMSEPIYHWGWCQTEALIATLSCALPGRADTLAYRLANSPPRTESGFHCESGSLWTSQTWLGPPSQASWPCQTKHTALASHSHRSRSAKPSVFKSRTASPPSSTH